MLVHHEKELDHLKRMMERKEEELIKNQVLLKPTHNTVVLLFMRGGFLAFLKLTFWNLPLPYIVAENTNIVPSTTLLQYKVMFFMQKK